MNQQRTPVQVRRRSLLPLAALAGLGIAGSVSGCASTVVGGGQKSAATPFPTFGPGELSTTQAKLVSIIKTEFDAQPPGTKYSQGVDEAWCADFVSWVQKQHGTPFRNPNSGGGWRIPGTMTLKEFFQSQGVWQPYGNGYQPVTGDVAIYDGNGPFGQHTNFVLRLKNSTLTTVGGNEPGGGIQVSEHPLNAALKLVGFGHWH